MLLLDKGRRTSLAWPFAERSIKGSPTIFRVPPKKVERGPLMMDRVPLPTKAASEEEAAAAFESSLHSSFSSQNHAQEPPSEAGEAA